MIAAALCVATTASIASADDTWSVFTSSDVRFFTWHGEGQRGDQVYAPYAVELVGRPNDQFSIDLLVRGGWVWAHQRQTAPGLEGEINTIDGRIDTITDTAISGTVTYYGWKGIQPFISLGLNLPTGEPALFGPAQNLRMDPNLVDMATFGEGFNIGPTVGFTLPVSANLMLTLSVGHTWRGSYDQASVLAPHVPTTVFSDPTAPIDPGDVSTVTGSIGYQVGKWSLTATGAIARETLTTEEGMTLSGPSGFKCDDINFCGPGLAQPFDERVLSSRHNVPAFDLGDRYFGSGVLSYDWGTTGTTTLDASASHTGKNRVAFVQTDIVLTDQRSQSTETTSFGKEPFNTNSDFFHLGLQHLFPVGQQFWIGPTGGWTFRTANGYPPGTLEFVPEQTRWSTGAVMRYIIGKGTLNARIERVWLQTGTVPGAAGSALSSPPTCDDSGVLTTNNSCNDVIGTGTAARPSTFFGDWQGVIGFNYSF